MNIDISLLYNHTVGELDITDTYTLPREYYENTDIVELKKVNVSGKITLAVAEDDYDQEKLYANCSIKGQLILKDSISLEPIDYDFSINYNDFIDENCIKCENLLDIFAFLWENIVLEVPLQFTKVKDLKQFKGEGWKLVSEDELVSTNNPFKDLLNEFEKE